MAEGHGTALEELRSSNEELQLVNDEFQSTNEELQTVNSQLTRKLEELDRKNTDLHNLFESAQVATLFLDPFLVIRGFTPAVAGVYDVISSDVGRPITDIVSPLDYTELEADIKQVLNTGQPLERRISRKDDMAHYLMRLLPYRTTENTVNGTVITFVDVSNLVRAENQQRLLVDELNHRVRNMLSVVIAIARQTLRTSTTLEEFTENYLGRVRALAATYTLLSEEEWAKIPMRSLLEEELKPFALQDFPNIVLEGPPTLLGPRSSLALGLAIHELTTNAVKHGALSVPRGVVKISWQEEKGNAASDGKFLLLEWTESGGPPVKSPPRRGFGLTVIERGLRQDMDAEIDMTFALEGLKAKLRAPLKD